MSIFRSEQMVLCQMFLQSEAAYACVSELGELAIVQFKDLNPHVNAFQRKFVNEIRRCEEMERKLRFFEKEIHKENLKIIDQGDNPMAPPPREMVNLESVFSKINDELREIIVNNEAIKRNYQELSELKEVMVKTQIFFQTHGGDFHNIVDDAQRAFAQDETGIMGGQIIQLGFVAGVIPREKVPAFERMLWFACRGNVFLRHEAIDHPLEDPMSGDLVFKDVFVIFFQGEQLKNKVKKICEGFKASLYPCPETPQERESMLRGVVTRLEDLKTVMAQTADHRFRVLVGAQREIRTWIIKVEKIKAIYHTLNMFNFDMSHNSLIAECWCPQSALDDVRGALRNGEMASGSTVPSIIQPMDTKKQPPTFFRTNKFTNGFQNIVNAYGIASYGEVNPALYTCITFPFLFAIMFGDAGHGLVMFLFGLWMIYGEKKYKAGNNEIANTFFGGRYIITLMGLFSIYTGLIYNDVYSKSVNIFGSAWRQHDYSNETLDEGADKDLMLDPLDFFRNHTPYPFGIDPVWQASANKIAFLNSLKMKLAVIIGISQMMFGIFLSLFNHLHFRKYLNILVEFIPEVIFLGCLFGYLVGLIFYKWVTFEPQDSKCAPALLIQYINMFMMTYNEPPVNGTSKVSCTQWTFYDNQKSVQISLLVLAVLSVPVLLFVKPVIMYVMHKKKTALALQAPGMRSTDALIENEHTTDETSERHVRLQKLRPEAGVVNRSVNSEEDEVMDGSRTIFIQDEEEDEKFEMGEVFIHQAIHTIEFCLGCISHTASYLRLWALSLAHAQLSEVLWSMVLSIGLKVNIPYGGGIIVFAVWFIWANLTVAILLLMEGLSAFLHTLRLHWVEFQSKFYVGEGVLFQPFTFKDILQISSLEDIK
ncbi:V-type proton ATPase 116 kDa subunit a 1-like isoform X2 [Babylonia areolata]|uniref:V-type proton ATPase 116 kDa subunit a 1-like isoform X2 n=1 Tax=Babylonia areolata TaxID=304850 RepID=UPI003FD5A040